MKILNPPYAKFYPLDDYKCKYLVHRWRALCPTHIEVPKAPQDFHVLLQYNIIKGLHQYHMLDLA